MRLALAALVLLLAGPTPSQFAPADAPLREDVVNGRRLARYSGPSTTWLGRPSASRCSMNVLISVASAGLDQS